MDKPNQPWNDKAPLRKFIGVLCILTAGVVFTMVMAVLFANWERILVFDRYFGGDTAPFSGRQAPPNVRGPRLQVDEFTDKAGYDQRQHEWLTTYGWVDEQKGVVRIPVDRAMRRLAERGLPTRGGKP